MCDASAGVAVSSNLFVAADDEGDQLRLFSADRGGPALRTYDVRGFLNLTGDHPEADFEGAAWLGDKVFWISSHGRNREGKYRANRHCFFATTIREDKYGVHLMPVGFCYKNLLTDLIFEPRLRPFNLAGASVLPPKAKGGLNIEGLCATADGHLLIGFRNPLPKGRALIVPILNPDEVIRGISARFGDPVLLDLGGLGIRDMGYWKGKIYLLAGSYDTEKKFRLYQWGGGAEAPKLMPKIDFKKLNPEALVFYPNQRGSKCSAMTGRAKSRASSARSWPTPRRSGFAVPGSRRKPSLNRRFGAAGQERRYSNRFERPTTIRANKNVSAPFVVVRRVGKHPG